MVAISVLNSEHLVYVGGSPSPDNTTGEPTEESDIDSSAAVALITISKGSQGDQSTDNNNKDRRRDTHTQQ